MKISLKLQKTHYLKFNEIKKLNKNWICFRTNAQTNSTLCKNCMISKKFRESLKEQAEKDNIDWKNEPCSFECGYDVNKNEYLTIRESIEKNHWK
jgi:hypothetical protein